METATKSKSSGAKMAKAIPKKWQYWQKTLSQWVTICVAIKSLGHLYSHFSPKMAQKMAGPFFCHITKGNHEIFSSLCFPTKKKRDTRGIIKKYRTANGNAPFFSLDRQMAMHHCTNIVILSAK